MAKLRKMLGDINDPVVVSLMGLIETQSADTLARWALSYVETNVVSIFKHEYPNDTRLNCVILTTKEYLNGEKTLKELKNILKEGKEIVKDVSDNALGLASLRAVLTACATKYSPTNALGYTFYSVAAIVYNKIGLLESKEIYDSLAKEEFNKILKSLKSVAVINETNPVKVNWNC